MNAIMDKVKHIWGANGSKGFKIGSWVAAIGVFSLWQYFSRNNENKKVTFSKEEATHWNNKVKEKQTN